MIETVKNFVPWIYVIEYPNLKKLFEGFTKKNCKNISQTKLKVEKVIKKNVNKLYVKWKGYTNSFNSWISKIEL